ncbi:MAG: LysM peptidoglycan-binding domain-containing protein [Paracoccaceae bacterium]
MKKAAAIYLALVLGMAAIMTGLPLAAFKWFASDAPEVAEAPPPEAPLAGPEATMAANSPAELAVAPLGQSNAATQIAATDPSALPQGRLAKPVVQGGDAGLDRTTSAILAELALIPRAEMTAEDAAMRDMSTSAITGLAALRGEVAVAQAPTLESLVVEALRAGQPDDYIDALVNEAAGSGAISVPSALVTSDGRVDTAVLLSTLVTKAQVASGAVEAVNPADVIAGGEGVEVRVVAQAVGDSAQNQFYTVASGDSLGSIAQKFYGDAVYFPAIFDANRTLLASPDQLAIGQRLVIPPASLL